MPWTTCCADTTPNGDPLDCTGWDSCTPLEIGDVTIGDIEVTADVDFGPVIDKLCEIDEAIDELDLTVNVEPPDVNIELGDVTTPVIAPCAGCILVDGQRDPLAFAVIYGDQSQAWFTVTSTGIALLDDAQVEQLDECDPRCLPSCCDPDLDGGCGDPGCDCDCDPEALAVAAQVFGGIN